MEELLSRRFFYRPSFEIYGAVAGFYDLGPSGCAIQANILSLWRQFFVLEEQMLELDCTIMTKDEVFVFVVCLWGVKERLFLTLFLPFSSSS